MKRWVLMVTEGTVLSFPPEVYTSNGLALTEAKRWRQSLSEIRRGPEDRDEEGPPWQVGDFSVRLIELTRSSAQPEATWIGTYWTADGYPDPEAILLADRAAAIEWVREPPVDFEPPAETIESAWVVASTYMDRGEETYAVAHRAKLVRDGTVAPASPPPRPHVTYDVEVTVSRLQRLEASVSGPPGLTREEIENLVEERWPTIAAQVTEDHVVTWELESFASARYPDPPTSE